MNIDVLEVYQMASPEPVFFISAVGMRNTSIVKLFFVSDEGIPVFRKIRV